MEQVQRAAGAFVLRKVYREMFRWGQTRQLRLAVVLDEAHRLARDVTLPKIMKEGRKYGVAVVVASQGVEDFHPDVLGNAGTKVAFRCNYPQSRKVAGLPAGDGAGRTCRRRWSSWRSARRTCRRRITLRRARCS